MAERGRRPEPPPARRGRGRTTRPEASRAVREARGRRRDLTRRERAACGEICSSSRFRFPDDAVLLSRGPRRRSEKGKEARRALHARLSPLAQSPAGPSQGPKQHGQHGAGWPCSAAGLPRPRPAARCSASRFNRPVIGAAAPPSRPPRHRLASGRHAEAPPWGC